MSAVITHPACGKSWKQHGNRSGHCAACHETFEGIVLFDWHQLLDDRGQVTCRTPADEAWVRKGLRLVEGTWRGPEWAGSAFGGGEAA